VPHRFNPRARTANNDPEVHPNPRPQQSLVEELGGTVDELRQLKTDFGLRPYRVFSVIERWSGGESGRGEVVVESEVELLPTPKVVDIKPVRGVATPAGLDEKGGIRLKEISPRYTEDDIRALFHVQPLGKDQDGFLEVRVDERDGSTMRRRFTIKGTPFRDAEKFEWSAYLTTQNADRSRAGQVQDDVSGPAEVQMARFSEG
jgi:hypothetical protein